MVTIVEFGNISEADNGELRISDFYFKCSSHDDGYLEIVKSVRDRLNESIKAMEAKKKLSLEEIGVSQDQLKSWVDSLTK